LDQGIAADTVYLDFSKAFDSVPNYRLLQKLECYGVRGSVLNWISSFLISCKQKVSVGEAVSTWAEVLSGVPGAPCSGQFCLFVILMICLRLLSHSYSSTQMIQKIFREIRCRQDADHLQLDLDKLCDWSRKWLLQFNISKCKMMHFGKSV